MLGEGDWTERTRRKQRGRRKLSKYPSNAGRENLPAKNAKGHEKGNGEGETLDIEGENRE